MQSAMSKPLQERQSVKEIVGHNLFLIKYMFKLSPFFVVYNIFYYAFHAVIVFIEHTLGIKLITDAIQYQKPFSLVIQYILLITALLCVSMVMGRIYFHSLMPKQQEKLYRKMRMDLYSKASKMDLACYDNPDYYNEFVLSINEVQTRIKNTTDYLGSLSTALAQIAVAGGFFFFMDKVGLIFVLVSLGSSLTVSFMLNKVRYQMRLELNVKERTRKYVNRVFYLADYAKELRLNNLSGKLKKDFRKSNNEIREVVQTYSKRMLLLSFLDNFVCKTFILDGLYLLYVAFMTLVKQAFSYGGAVALANSAWRLNQSILNLTQLAANFQENSLYIGKIRQFMAYEEQVVERANPHEAPQDPGVIELKNVSFAYSKEAGNIINNISLTIRPYEKIAFVGYNGAGKTTLMKLLMRLYDVSEGEILVDGTNVKDYKLQDYRHSYGTVFQDYQLFAASLAENVLLDERLNKAEQENSILAALEQSGFKPRLDEMDQGMDTPITREFDDKGTNLSGGEAQKVAIARVFHKSCPYIILDEPSSALDPISEYHMNQYMLEAASEKTVIFISHRLSTTRMADRIYMLEKGSIIEQGTHDELMRQNGKYAEMFNLQAERYRMVSGLN